MLKGSQGSLAVIKFKGVPLKDIHPLGELKDCIIDIAILLDS
jgi:hypothetical protein